MKKKIIIGVAILFVIAAGLTAFFLLKDKNEKTDAVKFAEEYPKVGKDNLFVYRSSEEIISILKNGTGVVYLGFPSCKWCQSYVVYLQDVAKNVGIEKIYYFDILEERKNNTENYQKIVELLGENLDFDDEGKPRVFVPDITVVKKGKIIGHDNESSFDVEDYEGPEEYWTEEKVTALKERLQSWMEQIADSSCTDCNL